MPSSWQPLLQQAGLSSADAPATVADSELQADLFACDHLAVLQLRGEDAEKFLQGQLTADVREVFAGHHRLAMHLNLKGRGMNSFQLLPADGGVDLLVPANRRDDALAALKKYAMFSKVTLEPADALAVLGFTNASMAEGAGAIALELPGQPRWLKVCDGEALATITHGKALAGSHAWRVLDIRQGLGHIYRGGEDLWLPQALNYDLITGVSFHKGCYLGQEVVARMHFKGRMKQRQSAWQYQGESMPPGTVLRDGDGKAIGEIVQCEQLPGKVEALAVIRLDHTGDWQTEQGIIAVTELALPYELPAEAAEQH